MASDISKNTVAILLILTIAVSAIGTYAVVTDTPDVPDTGSNSAQVNLDIAPSPPEASVSLTIAEVEMEDTI